MMTAEELKAVAVAEGNEYLIVTYITNTPDLSPTISITCLPGAIENMNTHEFLANFMAPVIAHLRGTVKMCRKQGISIPLVGKKGVIQ